MFLLKTTNEKEVKMMLNSHYFNINNYLPV